MVIKDPRVLTEEDKVRAYRIAKEIEDNLNAIKNELLTQDPFKGYLNDKLRSVKIDVDCLDSIFNEENDNE